MPSDSPQHSHALFDSGLPFDPDGNIDEFLAIVPARWVVYLLCDELDRPVQLLCVKNLRASLLRRLGPPEPLPGEVTSVDGAPPPASAATGLGRRIDYRALVRHIRWRRVDSAFEADITYFEIARVIFPKTYLGMTGLRPAWFVHVNPDAGFPRYIKTTNLSIRTGQLLGPIEDKHAANRLVEEAEDLFDLCRFYAILVQAPHGQACAYKGMGKCPAPCDGSISMPQYRRLVGLSLTVLQNPGDYVREQSARMGQAARELKFETAAKIKAYVDPLSKLNVGPYRQLDTLQNFRFLAVQRGPRAGTAKLFLVLPGRLIELLCLRNDTFKAADVMRSALETASAFAADDRLSTVAIERVGLIAHHLFAPKSAPGAFLRLTHLDERQIEKAYAAVQKKSEPAELPNEEGVLRELQAME